ncbi:hypothetical protein V6N11_002209 [Hibiscus sabdariffa]|uniref:Uncharacterized protein n=1 Tax=Hibiscus sabdariffa TaxID=183260 RepID=A0ABR2QUJ6_9ROSI
MDSGEKRLNELGYKQELRREMTLFKTLAISFSTMTLFTGITPLYGSSLQYAGPASLVWGWVVVSFFTCFVGVAMAEICSSFPTTGSLYFWAAHLAGPKWGPFSSWCCAWLETIGLIAGIVLNTFALEVIAFIDIISIWWQVIGGLIIVIMLPLVALTTKSASYVFTSFELGTDSTEISSKPYAVILSFLVSQYSMYGYDAAAHLTEETKDADRNGPIAILSSIGIISVFGWAYILALTFSIQDYSYLYDPSNETAGAFVPAQILYDAFHGRYHSSVGAIVLLCIIWGSFFFGGLSITTSAARVVSICSIKRQRDPFFIDLATSAPKAQSSIERGVAMRSYMYSYGAANLESECSVYGHNFHMHHRVGRWLCGSDICKNGNAGEELQTRSILFGQRKQTGVPDSLCVDLLYVFSVSFTDVLPDFLGDIQLCTGSFRCGLVSGNALVVGGCQEMVQGTCEEH